MINNQKERVLLVDDDLVVLKLLKATIGERYDVLVAPTAYDIETLIHHFSPNLIVLDIGLPDENGKDLCKSLRHRKDFDHIAILFLSGLHEPEVAAAAIQAGADGYLTKPFDTLVLKNTIAHLIESKRFSLLVS